MIETPQIIQTTSQLTATLHLNVPCEEIQNVMGPGINEVVSAVPTQGLTITGPWFTHHFRRPDDTFDFEICIPIATPFMASGRVTPGEWPTMKVARIVYQGDYSGLGDAWSNFLDWIDANGHATTDDLWERYLVDPSVSSDPAAWRTELNRPLR